MVLPTVQRCCCWSLRAGTLALAGGAAVMTAGVGAWCAALLPAHAARANEDDLLLMSAAMFSALALAASLLALAGAITRRAGYLQAAQLSSAVFAACLLLVAGVAGVYSPTLTAFAGTAPGVVGLLLALLALTAYSLVYLTVLGSLYTQMKHERGHSALPTVAL